MLDVGGIPGRALLAYRAAAGRLGLAPSSCRLPWELLAGIGFVESGHGTIRGGMVPADGRVLPPVLGPRLDGTGPFALIRDTDGGRLDGDPVLDRAVGPMQFLPSTWAAHGVDGDGNGTADPDDLDDAAMAAGAYLCVTSSRPNRPAAAVVAVYSYNHSYDYVRVVLTAAARYAGESPSTWGVDLLPPPASTSAAPSPSASPSPSPSASVEPEGPASQEPSPDASGEPSTSPTPATPEGTPAPSSDPATAEPSPTTSDTAPSPGPSPASLSSLPSSTP